MRKIKIVADSSADVMALSGVDFASVPMKVITDEQEFIDTGALDVSAMITYFDRYKGRSQTSCPNTGEWLAAFGDADEVFCVTITSGLSGSYSAACAAKEMYESEQAGKRVFVVDTLSAGPEMKLIIDKLAELIAEGLEFEEICKRIKAYQKKTGLLFMLKSLKNFAANGRVSPAVAKIVGIIGICIVGQASEEGQLQPLNKCRGENRSLATIIEHLKERGFAGGKICISHCDNEGAAHALKAMIESAWEKVKVEVYACRGLCSYYAEKGGMLVGFEAN